MEGYFKYLGTEPKDFRDNLREEALKKVKTRNDRRLLLLNRKAFEVSDDDIGSELEGMAKQYGLEADKAERNDRCSERRRDSRRYQDSEKQSISCMIML